MQVVAMASRTLHIYSPLGDGQDRRYTVPLQAVGRRQHPSVRLQHGLAYIWRSLLRILAGPFVSQNERKNCDSVLSKLTNKRTQ
jgi:hypothetical protein